VSSVKIGAMNALLYLRASVCNCPYVQCHTPINVLVDTSKGQKYSCHQLQKVQVPQFQHSKYLALTDTLPQKQSCITHFVTITSCPLYSIDQLFWLNFSVKISAVLWLRRWVTGLPQQRRGFDPRSVHVRFVVDEVTGTGFSPSTPVFPCRYRSVNSCNWRRVCRDATDGVSQFTQSCLLLLFYCVVACSCCRARH
jgi:hypothetical protein